MDKVRWGRWFCFSAREDRLLRGWDGPLGMTFLELEDRGRKKSAVR